MSNLNNKVVWLTGASSGIGEAIAYELARKGARLILSARRTEELERVKKNCPTEVQPNVRTLPLDLSKPDTIPGITQKAVEFFGNIDVLINNGGISQRSLIAETTLDVYRRIMEVNYFGSIALTKSLLPHLINNGGGQIATLSSVTGKFGTQYRSGYAASKHALHGFFDALRAEYWKNSIRVTMVCPGFINTPITLSALQGDGSPLNKIDQGQAQGMPVDWCARRIVHAIEKEKEEVYIGGKEILMVYIKRFFPRMFSRLIRKVAVR
jgi:short-subunit dehydrogenase